MQHAELGYETKFQTVQFPFDIKFIYYNRKKQNISAIELGDYNFVECFKKGFELKIVDDVSTFLTRSIPNFGSPSR